MWCNILLCSHSIFNFMLGSQNWLKSTMVISLWFFFKKPCAECKTAIVKNRLWIAPPLSGFAPFLPKIVELLPSLNKKLHVSQTNQMRFFHHVIYDACWVGLFLIYKQLLSDFSTVYCVCFSLMEYGWLFRLFLWRGDSSSIFNLIFLLMI